MPILSTLLICFLLMACGSKPEGVSKAIGSVIASPTVSIDIDLEGVTVANAVNFTMSGTCSEEGQPIIVSVEDLSPATAPTCTSSGTWSTIIDLTRLTGASRVISVMVSHMSSVGLSATQVTGSVIFYPRVTIASNVTDITGSNATDFRVSGTCSENGQAITVDVGGGSPTTAPLCTSRTWSTSVDVSGLIGASRPITITADHSTSGSSPLAATPAVKTVTLYPRVGISATVGNITGSPFTVSGTCSENGQAITVDVGGENPVTDPLCTSRTWSTSVDISGLLTGASRKITITADHSTSGSSPLAATPAVKTVTLAPRVGISATVGNIISATFTVNGTCSENGQAITVDVGGESPATAPLCTSRTWSTSVDVSGLTGASRPITITANHSTSGASPLAATPASKVVTLYPRVGISATVGNITGSSFTVNGTCSENGQAITVDVGGESPATAPLCTSRTWSTSVDVSGLLTGASRPITITANHSTSGSSPLAATPASKVVTLYPRVGISATVGNIISATFTVNGTCSENGQAITVDVGGESPATAPLCISGTWSISVDVIGLTGASRPITITANHSTSGASPLAATPASKVVTLYPRVGISATVGNITGSSFTVNGTCSENGQAITVDVGGESPATAPLCISGTWSTSVDVSGLGASRPITMTADHSTSGSSPLAAPQVSKTVTLYPRVTIATDLEEVTTVNAANFMVSGTCSENEQPVTVSVKGLSPETTPICTSSGTWSTTVDVTSLSEAAGLVPITADHLSSGGLNAIQATGGAIVPSTVSIATDLEDVTAVNAAHFVVSGTCSENEQPVTVSVENVSLETAPTCTSGGTWSTEVDVTGLNKIQNISITVGHLSSDGEAYSEATGSVTNHFICPENYVGVPSLTNYTTHSFCVMKYEAKSDGSPDNNAASQASGPPINLNRNSSITRCTALNSDTEDNYDLITNDEWQSVARNIELVASNWEGGVVGALGGLNVGHSDNSSSSGLEASNDDNEACFETGQVCDSNTWNSQRRTHWLSNGEVIWDVSGNVWEWVKDGNTVSYGFNTYLSRVTVDSHPALGSLSNGTTMTLRVAKDQFGPSGDYTSFSSRPYGGLGYGWLNNNAGAVRRGGHWSTTDSGVFAVRLSSSGTGTATFIGFRCVYHPSYE